MLSLEPVLTYPSTILILGDTGTGKTVTAMACAEHWMKEGYWIGMLDKIQKYPSWIHDVPSKDLQFPKDVKPVLVIDDAHAYYYAQETYMDSMAKKLDIINRARRHAGGCSVIYTTQDSTSLKKPLLRMANIIFFKQPPLLEEMDRPEIRHLYMEADKELKKVNYRIDIAYVKSKKVEGLVKIEKPTWFTEELSEGETFNNQTGSTMKQNRLFKFIAGLGKYS